MSACPPDRKWGKLPACPDDARCSRFSVTMKRDTAEIGWPQRIVDSECLSLRSSDLCGVFSVVTALVTLKHEPHTQPHSRNQDGCATLPQRGAKLAERAHLIVRSDTGDDVASEAAGDVSLGGWKIEFPNHQPDDRSEGIAVVKTKRRHAMAAPAKINRLIERHRQLMLFFPQLAGCIVAVGSRFVKRVLGRAKHRVLRCNHLPSERREPCRRGTHGSIFSRRLLRRFDLLKLGHPGTLEKPFPRLRIDRLRRETILDGQPFGHQLLEQRIVQQLGVNFRLHI